MTDSARLEPSLPCPSAVPQRVELLGDMAAFLLQCESGDPTADRIADSRRSVAALVSDWAPCAQPLGSLLQSLEQAVEQLADGTARDRAGLVTAALDACEVLADEAGREGATTVDTARLASIAAAMGRSMGIAQEPPCAEPVSAPPCGNSISADLVDQFKQEVLENIEAVESSVLRLEQSPADGEELAAVFRAVHNIKGAANYVGVPQIGTLAHHLEDVLDAARHGRISLHGEAIGLVFRSIDTLRTAAHTLTPSGEQPCDTSALIIALKSLVASDPAAIELAGHTEPSEHVYAQTAEQQLECIGSCLASLLSGDLRGPVLTMLDRSLTTLAAAVQAMGNAGLASKARQAAATARHCLPSGPVNADPDSADPLAAARSAILGGDYSDAALAALEEADRVLGASAGSTIGDRVRGFRQGQEAFRRRWRSLFAPEPSGHGAAPDPSQQVSQAAVEPVKNAVAPADQGPAHAGKAVRVDQGKLDDYLNLAQELVIARNALVHDFNQLAQGRSGGQADTRQLKESIDRMQRIAADIQNNAMSMRMVPVAGVFQRFPRMIRDIARTLNKSLELKIEGEDTEIDKQLAEKLADPLVHLVRNAADHGIEPPESRRLAGKIEVGTIRLAAAREAGAIVITIEDDGRGIDVERLKAKAIRVGLVDAQRADAMSHEEALQLIFAPGLSTAEQVSDLSGRGVGMDVVRSNIAALGGSVAVWSARGRGSRIRLQLPLTLAVSNVLLARADSDTYAIPMDTVKETVKVHPQHIKRLNHHLALSLRGKVVPLTPLRHALVSSVGGANGDEPGQLARDRSGRIPVVVIEAGGAVFGLAVDELKGQQEIVIKPLPSQLGSVPGLGGATIMGDGGVVLILDPSALYRSAC